MTLAAIHPVPVPANEDAPRGPADETPTYDLIELLFFAYRDFVGDPDRILTEYGFGRAHHRVLYFVVRNPGLTIAELLDILRITKQSLNRVLKELIGTGFIVQRAGTQDRRQRRLHATETGRALIHRLAVVQTRRIERALGPEPDALRAAAARFLAGMVDRGERDEAPRLAGAGAGRRDG